jgi:hypothetical protein
MAACAGAAETAVTLLGMLISFAGISRKAERSWPLAEMPYIVKIMPKVRRFLRPSRLQ